VRLANASEKFAVKASATNAEEIAVAAINSRAPRRSLLRCHAAETAMAPIRNAFAIP